jgi:hypothetical protein
MNSNWSSIIIKWSFYNIFIIIYGSGIQNGHHHKTLFNEGFHWNMNRKIFFFQKSKSCLNLNMHDWLIETYIWFNTITQWPCYCTRSHFWELWKESFNIGWSTNPPILTKATSHLSHLINHWTLKRAWHMLVEV